MKIIQVLVFKRTDANLDNPTYYANSEELDLLADKHWLHLGGCKDIRGIAKLIQIELKEYLSKKAELDETIQIDISFLSDFKISHVIGAEPITMMPVDENDKIDFWQFYFNTNFHKDYMMTKK